MGHRERPSRLTQQLQKEAHDADARIWSRHVPAGDGRPGRAADQWRPGDPEHRRGGGPRRGGRNRLLQHRRALPHGVHGLGGPCSPRRDRQPNGTDPARHLRNGPQHPGPGAAVHRLRHARRRVERPRAADRRPRLADGILPALRLRPRRLRGAVRGEARPARSPAARAARDLGGELPVGAHQPVREPADPRGPHPDLGRRRWQPAIGRARRTLRPAVDAGDHRRKARALRALRRALQARARAARTAGAADRAALAGLRRRDRRGGARDPVALLQGAVRVGGARARLAAADLRAVPGRGRSRLDVRRLARDRREQDRRRRCERSA